ncbi:TPA: hypothetical protein ACH3X2_000555 [Trebouxia sp. C0005]
MHLVRHLVLLSRCDVTKNAAQLIDGRQRGWTAFPDALDDMDALLLEVALQDFAHVSGRGRTLKGFEPACFQARCSPHDRPYQSVYRHRSISSAFRPVTKA